MRGFKRLHEAFAAGFDLDTERIIATMEVSPPPSATTAEKVQALRQWARGRAVPAD